MTIQISKNFVREEFEHGALMPEECTQSYTALCQLILEPIRAVFAKRIVITSGYRSPQTNQQAHGVANSQHVATAEYCAADFFVEGMEHDMRPVFDWVRLDSGLPFDQVTLEHGSHGDVVHISWARQGWRLQALEGATHNQTAYKRWPVTGVDDAVNA